MARAAPAAGAGRSGEMSLDEPEFSARRHARHPVRVPLYVSIQGSAFRKLIPLQSRDISAGGIGFETSTPLPLAARSRLVLSKIGDLPPAAMIEGRVVYSAQNPLTKRYSVGVAFTRMIQVTEELLLERIDLWERLATA